MQHSAARPQHVQWRQAAAVVCLGPVEQGQLGQCVWAQLLQCAPDVVYVERDGLQGSSKRGHSINKQQQAAESTTSCLVICMNQLS
jgi:hypothetical protein